MLCKLTPCLCSTVCRNSFSEVNLDFSVLLSEVIGDVGDVYLGPYMQFGAVGSFVFFWFEIVVWELLDGDFVSGIREFLLQYVGYFLGRRGWGAWVISGIWLWVGSGGGGTGMKARSWLN